MRLADYVMKFLADRGVEQAFLVTGGGAMHLNDALGQRDNPRAYRQWQGSIEVQGARIVQVRTNGLDNIYSDRAALDPANPAKIDFKIATRGRRDTLLIELDGASTAVTGSWVAGASHAGGGVASGGVSVGAAAAAAAARARPTEEVTTRLRSRALRSPSR